MDVKKLLESFKMDLTCVLCLGYLTDPVIVKCGHTFCKECLLSCWKEAHTPRKFPSCSEIIEFGDFLKNRRLQNMAIVGKMLRPHLLQSLRDLTICDTHGREETLFCEEDHRPLCGHCFLSTEHKEHEVLPLEKAVGRCMEKLQEKWDVLKQKKQKFQMSLEFEKKRAAQWELERKTLKETLAFEYDEMHLFILKKERLQLQKLAKETRGNLTMEEKQNSSPQEMLNLSVKFKSEGQIRKKAESEFQKKHQLLSEKKKLHLQTLDQEGKDNSARFEESKAKMTQQIHNFQMVMSEIEKAFEKFPIEMLLAAKETLERVEDLLLQNPVVASPRWALNPIPGLTEMLLTFHRDLTLDPETAHPHLLLSDDLKSIEYVSDPQDVPDNPERFDLVLRVLASQSFTSGKHYWEVEVGNKTEWEVGICKGSIRRKGKGSNGYGDTFTLLAFSYADKFLLYCSPHEVHVSKPIHKVGIFLDYERGHIAFYNAVDGTLICSPPKEAFQEPLYPCFSPCSQTDTSDHLCICSQNKKEGSENGENY